MIQPPKFPMQFADFYRKKGYWCDRSFFDILTERAQEHPDRVAFSVHSGCLTYHDLWLKVQKCASVFRQYGISEGDVVTIQLPNRLDFPVVFFSLELLGAVANTISPDFRSTEVEYILKFSNSKAYVCAENVRGFQYIPMIKRIVDDLTNLQIFCADCVKIDGVISIGESLNASKPLAKDQRSRVSGDQVIRMAFTSGTTGNPKGVLHSLNTTLYAASILNKDMCVSEKDVLLVYLPVGLNWGYLTLVQTVIAGARAVLLEKFSSEAALETIERERVTYIPTAPASVVAMLNNGGIEARDLSSVRVVVTGGASAALETIKSFQNRLPSAALIELYGMLETGFHTYTRIGDDPMKVNGTIGRVVDGLELKIVDNDGNDVVYGQEGEIAARGPSVHLGYFNNPEENAKSFLDDGWFLTGDLGKFVDASGNVMIIGRRKEIINRGGKKYFPREVEELLYAYPPFLQAVVVGLPDPRLGETNGLFAVLKEGEKVSLNEVVSFLRGKVADYKLPEKLFLLDELPMTPTGKVKRSVLTEKIGSISPIKKLHP